MSEARKNQAIMSSLNAVDLVNGKQVLLIWHSGVNPEEMRSFVEELGKNVGSAGHLAVEHVERLKACKSTEVLTVGKKE